MSTPSDPYGFGRRLIAADLRPLPDIDDEGRLIGTRMWWLGPDFVEYIALRPNGLAHAVRAESRWDFRRPAHHGQVLGRQFGAAGTALDWLLRTREELLDQPAGLVRPYTESEVGDQEGQ